MKFKKLLITILCIAVSTFFLFGCGSSSSVTEKDPIETAVNSRVIAKAVLTYGTSATSVVTQVDEESDGTFTAYGKVTCVDEYDDKYVGKFTVTGEVDETGNVSIDDVEIETPTRQ